MSKLKQALKDDFKKLYQPQFTTTWEAERLVRETEIDVMELQAIEAYIAEQTIPAYESGKASVWAELLLSNVPKNKEVLDLIHRHMQHYNDKLKADHLSKRGKE